MVHDAAEQAEALCLRVSGRSLSRSTLAREAQRQGASAQLVRQLLLDTPLFNPQPAK